MSQKRKTHFVSGRFTGQKTKPTLCGRVVASWTRTEVAKDGEEPTCHECIQVRFLTDPSKL